MLKSVNPQKAKSIKRIFVFNEKKLYLYFNRRNDYLSYWVGSNSDLLDK